MPLNSSDHRSNAPRPQVFGLTPPHVDPACSVLRSALQSSQRYAGIVGALAGLVGGIDALEQLNDNPIADDPFDWTVLDRVDRVDRAVVTAVLAEIDRCPDYIVDNEYRTVAHRLLELVATFGDDLGDDEGENAEVLALTIPDARLLVTFLQRALDAAHVTG